MHVELGGYHVRDLEFVAAFDVDATKVARLRDYFFLVRSSFFVMR